MKFLILLKKMGAITVSDDMLNRYYKFSDARRRSCIPVQEYWEKFLACGECVKLIMVQKILGLFKKMGAIIPGGDSAHRHARFPAYARPASESASPSSVKYVEEIIRDLKQDERLLPLRLRLSHQRSRADRKIIDKVEDVIGATT